LKDTRKEADEEAACEKNEENGENF